MHDFVPVFALLVTALGVTTAGAATAGVAQPSREYWKLCGAIADHAQAASRAFNSNDVQGAHKYFGMAEAAYKRAVAISPDHPYAFMNFGNLLSNANRFDEALHVLAAAMERLEADPNADADALKHVKDTIHRTLYGQASMRRDSAYREGQGNITAAMHFALQQLPLSPFPPRTLHDIATMELMLCDADPLMCDSARDRLRQAQQSSVVQYMTERAKLMHAEAQALCPSSASVLSGDHWLRCPDISQQEASLPTGLVALSVAPPLRLLGRDAVVLLDDLNGKCACSFLSPASDPLLDVFANCFSSADPHELQSASGLSSYVSTLPLLSLVQFAATSFYHWMCEVLPRLVVAQAVWGVPSSSSAKYNVLIPASPTSFMTESLVVLGVTNRIDYRRRLIVTKAPLLYVTWTAQSVFPNKTSGFSLAHPYALQLLRTRLLEHVNLHPQQRPSIVVASRGGKTGMRHFDEKALILALSASMPSHDIVVADGSQPLLDNLALFAAASAVVGAHGGALANIVVCPASIPVVEIGFASEASWHYEHVAHALQLRHARVLADADPLLRSVGAARISVNITAVVVRLQHMMSGASDAVAASSGAEL